MADASNPTVPVAARGRGDPVCPFLGLPDDPPTRFSFPSEDHRCWAAARPRTIDLPHQGAFCLAAAHLECPRYREVPAEARAGAGAGADPVSGTSTVAATVDWRGGSSSESGGPRRARTIATILLVALLLALAALIVGPAILDLARGSQPGSAGGSPSPMTTTPAPSTPNRSPSPSPTSTPTPTPSLAAAPSPGPTPSPAVRPTPTLIRHVVTRGETLTSIAERYGVTVAALQRANALDDPNLIRVGQRLVIPRRQ